MKLKFDMRVKVLLFLIFLLYSNASLKNEKKQVKIIYLGCRCDADHSVNFEIIKAMGSSPCSA